MLISNSLCRHGAQGELDGASNGTLEQEFGSHNEEEVVKQILEKGNVQSHAVREISLPYMTSEPILIDFRILVVVETRVLGASKGRLGKQCQPQVIVYYMAKV